MMSMVMRSVAVEEINSQQNLELGLHVERRQPMSNATVPTQTKRVLKVTGSFTVSF